MNRILLSFLLFLFSLPTQGQVVGSVLDAETQEGLPAVLLRWENNEGGALSDGQGKFELVEPASYPARLLVSLVGYHGDTLSLDHGKDPLHIALKNKSQETVVISGNLKPTYVSRSPIKIEVITREFIQKLPANNVMEVVDYVNGVRSQVNCGVCGTNDIHINGMEGPYTLVLIDGMPIISALGTVYGLNGIPSSMIERIEIIKGPNSTLYGSEAVAGTINIITRDPEKAALLFAESTLNHQGESNTDLAFAPNFKKASTLLSANLYHLSNRIDQNGDNFTDLPLSQRLSLFNKWTFKRRDHRQANIAAKAYYEDRFGGVMQWQAGDRGSDSIYGESIRTHRAELIGSYQLPISGEHVRVDFSFSHHDQDSWYGNTPYKASQQIGFANLLWYHSLGERHRLLTGLSGRYNGYDDNTPATSDPDRDFLPGIFLQDEITFHPKLSGVLGLRYDYHPDHGGILSPRVNVRYKPGTYSTFRLSGGSGFRSVNIFTEEHAALTGSRQVVIEGTLAPERSLNANANYNQVYNLGNSAGTLDMDLFYTYFSNKIIPDYDSDPNLIIYRNLPGYSIIRGASVSLSHSFSFPLSLDLGFTYMDVFSADPEQGLMRIDQEFAPQLTGVWSLSYRLPKVGLNFDYTGRMVGSMHLPEYDPPFERPSRSPAFSLHNLQLRKQIGRHFELILQAENLLNYTQNSPLINPSDPFSNEFDTAYIYGPTQGRRFGLGLSFRLDQPR